MQSPCGCHAACAGESSPIALQVAGGPGPEFDKIIREGCGRLVEGDKYSGDMPGFGGGGFKGGASMPAYATVPTVGGAPPPDQDPRWVAPWVLCYVWGAILFTRSASLSAGYCAVQLL